MAAERARLLFCDPQRLVRLVLEVRRAEGPVPPSGPKSDQREIVLIEPGPPSPAGDLGDLYVWWTARGTGADGGRGRRPELLNAEQALDRLRDSLSPAPVAYQMLLSSRIGGEMITFRRGVTRRLALSAGEAEAAVEAMLGRGGPPGHLSPAPAAVPSRPPPHPGPPPAAADGRAAAWLDPASAGSLLQAIGLAGPRGRVLRDQRRKYNQIVHLTELLSGVLERMPEDRELLVVDCGCGKSQLLLILNHVLTERLARRAQLVGIDSDPEAVAAARALQQRLGYRNMEFVTATVRSWPHPDRIDLVLSLHACDTATDEALALGIVTRAQGVVAVPCCQQELAPQVRSPELDPVLRHATLRIRFGDWLTDALRALILESHGYDVDVIEYVSPLDTPKNILIRAERRTPHHNRMAAAGAHARAIAGRFSVDPSLPRLIAAMRQRPRQ